MKMFMMSVLVIIGSVAQASNTRDLKELMVGDVVQVYDRKSGGNKTVACLEASNDKASRLELSHQRT